MGEFEDDPHCHDEAVFSSYGVGEGVSHDGKYGLVRKSLPYNQYYGRPDSSGSKKIVNRTHVDDNPESCK